MTLPPDSTTPATKSPERDDHYSNWTTGRIAAIILLVILCASLVWNAYTWEDIYYADLDYDVVSSDTYEPQKDKSVLGRTLKISDTYYPKGLGVHANTEIHLRWVPPSYTYFTAEIGIDADAEETTNASVIFSVIADGTLLYQSPILKAGMLPRLIYVPIRGRRTLTLKVDDAGDGTENDYAVWAMARFIHQ